MSPTTTFRLLTTLVLVYAGQVFAQDASFRIRRFEVQLSPATQTLLLQSEQGDPKLNLDYDGRLDAQMTYKAELIGPGLSAPVSLSAPALSRLMTVPRTHFTETGDYQVINVRLERNGQILGFAQPRTAEIRVVEDLLITEVDVREIGLEELTDLGYVFNEQDFRAVEFELSLVVGAKPIQVKPRVVFPKKQRTAYKPVIIDDPFQTSKINFSTPALQDAFGGADKRKPESDVSRSKYLLSLMVFPGEFQFLRTHFSVGVVTLNASPDGFDISVDNLKADLQLPEPNFFGAPVSLNDGQGPVRDMLGPGPNGIAGDEDDISRLAPGEKGRVDYIVTGNIEGVYPIRAVIRGEVEVDGEVVGITSVGSGRMLVRNPDYTVTVEHPDAVAINETFEITFSFHNKGAVALEGLSVGLNIVDLVGSVLADGESPIQTVASIAPGEEGSATFLFEAEVAGRVVSSYFKVKDDVPNRMTLSVAVGSNQERISEYVVAFPQEFFDVFPSSLTQSYKSYAKKIADFSQMSEEELPDGVLPGIKRQGITSGLRPSTLAAHSVAYGWRNYGDGLLRLFSNWMRAEAQSEPIDSIRRHITAEGNLNLENLFGTELGATYTDDLQLLEDLMIDNEAMDQLQLAIVETDVNATLNLIDSSGRVTNAGPVATRLRELPFAAIIPLSPGKWLLWASGDGFGSRLEIQPSSGSAIRTWYKTDDGMRNTARINLPDSLKTTVAWDVEQESLLVSTAERAPRFYPTNPASSNAFAIEGAFQVSQHDMAEADYKDRSVVFVFSKALELNSFRPLDQKVFINDVPVADARLLADGRFLTVTSGLPIGPYRQITYRIQGVRSLDGQVLGEVSGVVTPDVDAQGVIIRGRVVDHMESDITQAAVFLLTGAREDYRGGASVFGELDGFSLDKQMNVLHQVFPNQDGAYDFDFAPYTFLGSSGLSGTVLEVMVILPDGRFEKRRFDPLGPGQELIADFVFNHRGVIYGQVTDRGAPVSNVTVFATNTENPDSTELVQTDANGWYRIEGMEVGQIQVKTAVNEFIGYQVDTLTFENSPLRIDLTADNLRGDVVGTVFVETLDGDFVPLMGAQIAFQADDVLSGANITRTITDSQGQYRLNDVPLGSSKLTFFHPRYNKSERPITLTETLTTADHIFEQAQDRANGSVSGVVRDDFGNPLAGALVYTDNQSVRSGSDGSWYLQSIPAGDNVTIEGEHTDTGVRLTGKISIPVTTDNLNVTNQELILTGDFFIRGRMLDEFGAPMSGYQVRIMSGPNWEFGGTWLADTDQQGYFTAATSYKPGDYTVFMGTTPQLGGTYFYLDEDTEPVTIHRRPRGSLQAQIVDAEGNPVVGFITLTHEIGDPNSDRIGSIARPTISLLSDGEGRVTFPDINQGDIEVYGSSILLGNTNVAKLEFDPNDENAPPIVLAFPQVDLGQLSGYVFDTDGISPAPAGTKVTAYIHTANTGDFGIGDVGLFAEVDVNAEGGYTFAALVETSTPAKVDLMFHHPTLGLFAQERLVMDQHLRFRQDAVLRSSGTVRVQVEHADGRPAEFGNVLIEAPHLEYLNMASISEPIPRITSQRRVMGIPVGGGEVVFADVPGGAFTLLANAEGLAGMRQYAMPAQGGDLVMKVRLEASGDIAGTFVKHDLSAIADGEVQLLLGQNLVGQQASGPDGPDVGRFAFTDLPMRTYKLAGRDPETNFLAETAVTLSPYADDVDVTLKLNPLLQLEGTVRDNQGLPVAGAKVGLGYDNEDTSRLITMTDVNGVYRFPNMPSRGYRITATSRAIPGVATTLVDLPTGASGAYTYDLQFGPTRDLEFQILMVDGTPAANQLIKVFGDYGASGFTDASGLARFEGVPYGDYMLVAVDQLGDQWISENFGISEATPQTLRETYSFQGFGVVTGQVLTSLGAPLDTPAVITVTHAFFNESILRTSMRKRRVLTDAEGFYRIVDVPVSGDIVVSVFHKATEQRDMTFHTLTENGQEIVANLTLEPATSVSGTVVFDNGDPAPDAFVQIHSPFERESRVNATGGFFFDYLLEGDQQLTAIDTASARRAFATVPLVRTPEGQLDPVNDVELRLSKLGRVRGVVRYSDGSPVISGNVRLLDPFGREHAQAPIFADGTYRTPEIATGTYFVKAYDHRLSRESNLASVTLTQDGGEQIIDLTYEPSHAMRGFVYAPGGVTPVHNALIEVWGPTIDGDIRRVYATETDVDGRYEIFNVYPGLYRVYITSPDVSMVFNQDDFVMPGSDHMEDFTLENIAWLVGTTTDVNGRILSGEVTLEQFGQTHTTFVAGDGTFFLDKLSPGAYRLTMNLSGGWIQLEETGILTPGSNPRNLTADATVSLSGQYFTLDADNRPTQAALRVGDILRDITPDASGQFVMDEVPGNTDVDLVMWYNSSRQTTALGSFNADGDIGTITLDPTPPLLSFMDDGATFTTLPQTLTFDVGEAESSIDESATRIWLNGYEISGLATTSQTAVTLPLDFDTTSLQRGENQIRVRVYNPARAFVSKTYSVNFDLVGTRVVVTLKDENNVDIPGDAAFGDQPVWLSSGADDKVVLDNVPFGTQLILGRSQDQSIATGRYLVVNSTQLVQEFTLPLHPYGEYRGVVTNDQGAPVSGVHIHTGFGSPGAETRTAADGSYVLSPLSLKSHRIYAETDDGLFFAERSGPTLRLADQVIIGQDLVLRGAANITGVVRDEVTLQPVSGVTVYLTYDDLGFYQETYTTTAVDGTFSFDPVWSGDFTLRADDDTIYRTGRGDFTIAAGQTLDVEILLEPSVALTGTVINSQGAVVANATVAAIHDRLRFETTTDASGVFRLEGLRDGVTYWVGVSSPDEPYEIYQTSVATTPPEVDLGTIQLGANQAPVISQFQTPAQVVSSGFITAQIDVSDDFALARIEVSYSGPVEGVYVTDFTKTWNNSTTHFQPTSYSPFPFTLYPGTLNYEVRVEDQLGAVTTLTGSVEIVEDLNPTTITRNAPLDGFSVPEGQIFVVDITAADPDGVDRAEFYREGVLLDDDSQYPNTTLSFQFTDQAFAVTTATAVNYEVRVFDVAGNATSESFQITITPITTSGAPTLAVSSPLHNQPQPIFLSEGLQVPLVAQFTDPDGLESWEWRIDGTVYASGALLQTSESINTSWTVPAALRGAAQLNGELAVRDLGGNEAVYSATLPNVTGEVHTTPLTIGVGDIGHDGLNLILVGGEHVIDGAHSFTGLYLVNGANLTQSATLSDESYLAWTDLTVTGDVVVNADSIINLKDRGYPDPHSPLSMNITDPKVRGSHGGLDATPERGFSELYGSALQPTLPGRHDGGGALRLHTGQLWLVGDITTDDATPGSLWVSANTFHGNGLISADSIINQGGGRIRIDGDYAGPVQAYGGDGGAGTVYRRIPDVAQTDGYLDQLWFEDRSDRDAGLSGLPGLYNLEFGTDVVASTNAAGDPILQVLNPFYLPEGAFVGYHLFLHGQNTPLGDAVDHQYFGELKPAVGDNLGYDTLVAGDHIDIAPIFDEIVVGPNAVFDLQGHAPRAAVRLAGGKLISNTPVDLSAFGLTVDHGELVGDFTTGDLTLQGELVLNGHLRTGALTIGPSGIIRTPFEVRQTAINIHATDIVLEGSILSKNTGSDPALTGDFGSAHGGKRVRINNYSVDESLVSQTIGSLYYPQSTGQTSSQHLGHYAGGRVSLHFNSLDHRGLIDVTARTTEGGSGGAVLLEGSLLIGSGSVLADGGPTFQGYAGAGRIAVLVDDIAGYSGQLSATGYRNNDNYAASGAGTIYTRTSTQPNGHLLVDNTGLPSWTRGTELPGLGQRTTSQATGDGPVIVGDNFPDSLAGLYVVVDGYAPVRIASNTSTELIAEAGQSFPPLAAGDAYSGLHILDELSVKAGGYLYSIDPIELGQNPVVDADATLEAVFFATGGVTDYADATFVITDDTGLNDINLTNATVRIQAPVNLGAVTLDATSTLILEAPLTAGVVTVDGGQITSQTRGEHLVASELRLRNGALWTAADTANGERVSDIEARVTGIVEIDATSAIRTRGADNLNDFRDWGTIEPHVTTHGGRGGVSFNPYVQRPFAGSFAQPEGIPVWHMPASVKLSAGELQLNGAIDVSAARYTAGAIWLDTPVISGAGSLLAKPNLDYTNGNYGGGRIAIYHGGDTTFLDTLDIQLTQTYTQNGFSNIGGAGTLYLKSPAQTHGELIIDQRIQDFTHPDTLESRFGLSGVSGPAAITLTVDDIDADPLVIQDNTLTGAELPPGLAGLHAVFAVGGTTYDLPIVGNTYNSLTFGAPGPAIVPAGTELRFVLRLDRLTLRNGAQFAADMRTELGDLVLEGSGLNTIAVPDISLPSGPLIVTQTNLRLINDQAHVLADTDVILTDATLVLDKPTTIRDLSLTNANVRHSIIGNSANSRPFQPRLNLTARHIIADATSGFDVSGLNQENSPINLGFGTDVVSPFLPRESQGQNTYSGGILEIHAQSIQGGVIRADGMGGRGGSILIDADTLSGDIQISADAGSYDGGRIAVYYGDRSGANLTLSAYTSASRDVGSIFLKSDAQSYGEILIDEQGQNPGHVMELPYFPPQTLTTGFSAVFDGSTTDLLVPGLDWTYTHAGATRTQDFTNYWLVRNGDPTQSYRIAGNVQEGGDMRFSIEGDLSALVEGDALHLAVKLDAVTGCSTCTLGPTGLMILDDLDPVIGAPALTGPLFGAQLLPGRNYEVAVNISDNIQLASVTADVDGLTPTFIDAVDGLYRYSFTASAYAVDTDIDITFTATDAGGRTTVATTTYTVAAIDDQAPVVTITAPLNLADIETQTAFDVQVSVSDNREIANLDVTFFGETQSFTSSAATLNQTANFNAPVVPGEQIITITATATDIDGNTGSTQIDVRVFDAGASAAMPAPVVYWTYDNTDMVSSKHQDVKGSAHMVDQSMSSTTSTTYRVVDRAGYFFSSSRGETAPFDLVQGTDTVAVATWVTVSSFRENGPIFVYGEPTRETFSIRSQTGDTISFNVGGQRLDTPVLTRNQRYHLVALYNAGAVSLYLDGVAVATATWPAGLLAPNADDFLYLGRITGGDNNYFQGYLDETLFFNQPLTPTHVQELQQQGLNGLGFNAAPLDFRTPGNPDNLSITAVTTDSLTLSWTKTADADLSIQHLYVDGAAPIILGNTDTSYTLTGLTPLTRYSLRLTSVDTAGNESAGETIIGVTEPTDYTAITRPVSYYSFESSDRTSYKPHDLLGNHPAVQGAALTVSSSIAVGSSAFNFSQTSHGVTVKPGPELGQSFAISAWIRTNRFKVDEAILHFGDDAQTAFTLTVDDTDAYRYTLTIGSGYRLQTPIKLDRSGSVLEESQRFKFQHFAIHYDNGHLRLYIDGELVVEDTAAPALPTLVGEPVLTMAKDPLLSKNFSGYLDELVIWTQTVDPALTAFIGQHGAQDRTMRGGGDQIDFRHHVDITNLSFTPTGDSLTFNWTKPSDNANDLVSYRVYVDGATTPVDISDTQTSYALSGLFAMSRSDIRITTLDTSGNESPGTADFAWTSPTTSADIPRPLAYWTYDSIDRDGVLLLDLISDNHAVSASASSSSQGIGHSLSFGSTAHHVEFDGHAGLDFQDTFTLRTRARINDTSGRRPLISYSDATERAWTLAFDRTNDNQLFFQIGAAYELATPVITDEFNELTYEIPTSQWLDIVVRFDAGALAIFVDGELIVEDLSAPAAIPLLTGLPVLSIAREFFNQGTVFSGQLEETVLWDVALTDTQIAAVAQFSRLEQNLRDSVLDFHSPDDVTNFQVVPASDQLSLTWTASTSSDVTGYRLYIDAQPPVDLAANAVDTTVTGLLASTFHNLRLTVLDDAGNESGGVTTRIATLPTDPTTLPTPVSYWSFDPVHRSGVDVLDAVGANHSTRSTTSSQSSQAVSGRSYAFFSSEIDIAADTSLDADQTFTLMLWAYQTNNTTDGQGLYSYGSTAQTGYGLFFRNDGATNTYSVQTATDRLDTLPHYANNGALVDEIERNIWRHLTLTFDNGLVRLYLDGVFQQEATWPSPMTLPVNRLLALGRDPVAAKRFQGYLDEVAFWDVALTEQEISIFHQRGKRGESLLTAEPIPPATTLFTSETSFENRDTVIFDGEWLETDGLTTPKRLEILNSHLVLSQGLTAHTLIIDADAIIEATGENVVLRAHRIEIQEGAYVDERIQIEAHELILPITYEPNPRHKANWIKYPSK